MLAEALGPKQFRERVKIYATDLDEDALHQARTGTYEADALADRAGLRESTSSRPGPGTPSGVTCAGR